MNFKTWPKVLSYTTKMRRLTFFFPEDYVDLVNLKICLYMKQKAEELLLSHQNTLKLLIFLKFKFMLDYKQLRYLYHIEQAILNARIIFKQDYFED